MANIYNYTISKQNKAKAKDTLTETERNNLKQNENKSDMIHFRLLQDFSGGGGLNFCSLCDFLIRKKWYPEKREGLVSTSPIIIDNIFTETEAQVQVFLGR